MCRYGMTTYKPHYACFDCKKAFKRRLLSDILDGTSKDENESPAKCPECGRIMADMGLDFEAPKKSNGKAWKHISDLYRVGITFHSCGCSGPGYIPNDSKELINHLSGIKDIYLENQHFWAKRNKAPETQSEIAKNENENGVFLRPIPIEMWKGTKNDQRFDSSKAQIYWGKKVVGIEQKIQMLTNASTR